MVHRRGQRERSPVSHSQAGQMAMLPVDSSLATTQPDRAMPDPALQMPSLA